MKKQKIFIINGQGESGKDTFIDFVKKFSPKTMCVLNYSTVDPIKEIASQIGWTREKKEKERKFLSDLKLLSSQYNDFPYQNAIQYIASHPYADVIFIHCREPEEIQKFVKDFNAKTILIKRGKFKKYGNVADDNVNNFKYDIIIENDGTLENLMEKTKSFIKNTEVKK